MKGQHLFYSFLPGVTAAVLTTQPAVAEAMKVSSVQLVPSSSVVTTQNSQTLLVDKNQTQLPNATVQIFPDIIPTSGVTTPNLQFSSSHSHPVILTENTGIDREQKSRKDEVKNFPLKSKLTLSQRLKQKRFPSQQKQINSGITKPKLVTKVASATSTTLLAGQQTFSPSYIQNPAPQKKLQTQLPMVLQATANHVGAAKLLNISSCSPQTCQLTKLTGQQIAQGNTTQDPTAAPVPEESTIVDIQAPTDTPVQTESVPADTQSPRVAPVQTESAPVETQAPVGAVEVPPNLIPNANPLQFPTKPEEVTLKENQPITLTQALELARRSNRDLQVSLLELQRTQALLREAQAALLPNLSVSSDVTRSQSAGGQLQNELISKQGGVGNNDEPGTAFNSQAQLSYDLYTSGRRKAAIQEAEEQVRFNELDVERQSEEIRLSVTRAYYDLQQADEQVRIARSAVENAQASLRDAEALERAGVGTRFDVLRSQVNLANNTQQLTNNLSRQQTTRRQLATLLSIPQAVNISAADPVQLAGLWNQSLEQSIILAYQNRPELHQQLAQRNISEQQRRQALATLGPQVSFVANYNLLDQFDDGVGLTDGYSVGVRATLNLYDGGAARARASQARANIAIAETRFASQRDQVRFQVEQAFTNQRSNLENVQTANVALEQAREALRLARLRFQAGVGTQTDVINSENDLTQAEGNRITAILDYNRALAELQRAVTSRALISSQ
ncbi:Outer membrane efflux protein [Trichormus variabilis ATCC 29413]|uniref:Outer membrane efflux protein n=2 Tax=Anabaena variabilis TaxID=264691 RepID=Q3MEE7_TRIV2|nr:MULTISPECIES: TolC family protein [Nostocaceae]ABA20639.1 Outer membrane efflux protein [Trichormus variabilis ATCC 29413]MBC1216769.1 TolC family protein [Trichormus variabilis ARAD]MBC1256449.1 TolC family protein [Trichormus variabilis V5]MBC1268519.1 TolC family protein [Trichormus variabilis FSR]MBC1300935.1 TolC family protein [Trichormus variabilis N2B]